MNYRYSKQMVGLTFFSPLNHLRYTWPCIAFTCRYILYFHVAAHHGCKLLFRVTLVGLSARGITLFLQQSLIHHVMPHRPSFLHNRLSSVWGVYQGKNTALMTDYLLNYFMRLMCYKYLHFLSRPEGSHSRRHAASFDVSGTGTAPDSYRSINIPQLAIMIFTK